MKIEEIWDLWDKDCVISRTQLDIDSIETAKIHNKYLRILATENKVLATLKEEQKVLTLEKEEFLTSGPTKETNDKGWKLPAKGVIRVNKEVEKYLQADPDIIEMNLAIVAQQDKVDTVKAILSMISNRTFQIKNAIDFQKMINGN